MIIKTAGIFILNQKRELLLGHITRHSKDSFSIMKGCIESTDLCYLDAAKRELFEESNIDLSPYSNASYIFLNQVTFRNKRKTLYPYLLLLERNLDLVDYINSVELKCNTYVKSENGDFPEVDGYKWVSLEEAKFIVHESQVHCIIEIESILKEIDNNKNSTETITDDYSTWSAICPACGLKSMEVVRVGKVQCIKCV